MLSFLSLAPLILSVLVPSALAAPTELAARQATVCGDLTVIYARGTTEPGPDGYSGLGWDAALVVAMPTLSINFTGVTYAANVTGFLEGGDPAGSAEMTRLVNNAAINCPKTSLVVSGYSQGGQLVHNSAKNYSSAAVALIKASVIFGDPDSSVPVAQIPLSRQKVYCDPTDDICQGGDIVGLAHLSYSKDFGDAANFVKSEL